MLQCSAMQWTPQHFVNCETSSDLPSAWGGVDKGRIFLFWVNCSFIAIAFCLREVVFLFVCFLPVVGLNGVWWRVWKIIIINFRDKCVVHKELYTKLQHKNIKKIKKLKTLGDLLECLTNNKHRPVWLLDEYIKEIMFSCLGYTKTILFNDVWFRALSAQATTAWITQLH